MVFLLNHTKESPAAILKPCLLLPDDQGYKAARAQLEMKFGSIIQVRNAYRDKTYSWPSIKLDDIDSLDKFCIMLISSRNAMLCMPPKERE